MGYLTREQTHDEFQSTRPARGATRGTRSCDSPSAISIHAPREGRDGASLRRLRAYCHFNPRAPRGARRSFQRTFCVVPPYFNPRAPRGARPYPSFGFPYAQKFQSTRPARGATQQALYERAERRSISIHAPREGRDRHTSGISRTTRYFNPRAPRGARHSRNSTMVARSAFQSTRPARGATHTNHVGRGDKIFQSTRPARGATAKVNKFLCTFLQKRHGFQILLRKTLPFKAFCRLQIGKNFSICGANRCGNFCELLLRTIRSSVLPEGRSACSQNAQFYSHTFSRDNRNADCLFPDP